MHQTRPAPKEPATLWTGSAPEWRDIYSRALDPEQQAALVEYFPSLAAEFPLSGLGHPAPDALATLERQAADWAARERQRFVALWERVTDPADIEVLLRRTALAVAPLGLAAGAWLQWLSTPANADQPNQADLMTLYSTDVGVGYPRADRGSAYLGLLRTLRLAERATPVTRLTDDFQLRDLHFALPAQLIGAGRFPSYFLPQVQGADLCLRVVGSVPALTPLRADMPAATDWSRLDFGFAAGGRTLVDFARQAATRLVNGPGDEGAKLVAGFSWALAKVRHWSEQLLAELAAALDPAYEMAEMVRSRARDGAVYHRHFMIGDRPLSDWLRTGRDDPDGLLRALAASRLVKPGRPEASLLVQGLVSERGPMFRVFSDEELAVMSRWIGSLGSEHGGCAVADMVGPERAHAAGPEPESVARFFSPPRPTNLREAYRLLAHRESSAQLDDFADRYVRGWLARAAYRMEPVDGLPPANWRPRVLRSWLHQQHERHDLEFEEGRKDALPSREDLVDATVQLAPLTLIDGGWLQGFTAYAHASSEVGHFLYETYWDELGNGKIPLNHPVIFREVLADMGVTLPPTGSPEFSQWAGFHDESFELPVYWLCLSRFPSTYQAETLGMNLAMELSGVGGSYRRAQLTLEKYGFSTRFVDIHNTIDNVATGHSAWAADAIDAYMSGVASMSGSGALQSHWDRVRIGYRSLNPPATRGARRAERLATRRFHTAAHPGAKE